MAGLNLLLEVSPSHRATDKHFLSSCRTLKACSQRLNLDVFQHQKVTLPHHWIRTNSHFNFQWKSNSGHCQLTQYAPPLLSAYSGSTPHHDSPFLHSRPTFIPYSSWSIAENRELSWVHVGIHSNHWFWSWHQFHNQIKISWDKGLGMGEGVWLSVISQLWLSCHISHKGTCCLHQAVHFWPGNPVTCWYVTWLLDSLRRTTPPFLIYGDTPSILSGAHILLQITSWQNCQLLSPWFLSLFFQKKLKQIHRYPSATWSWSLVFSNCFWEFWQSLLGLYYFPMNI